MTTRRIVFAVLTLVAVGVTAFFLFAAPHFQPSPNNPSGEVFTGTPATCVSPWHRLTDPNGFVSFAQPYKNGAQAPNWEEGFCVPLVEGREHLTIVGLITLAICLIGVLIPPQRTRIRPSN